MYSVDNHDKVTGLENVPQSSVGAPLPILLSDEYKTLLAYVVESIPEDWDGTSVRVVDHTSSGELVALIEFRLCHSIMFGSPNDEAFDGHPLASRGLEPYGAFLIENSSWVRQLERMNSVHPNHRAERFARLNHYVFAFHDSTFECVAEGFETSLHRGSLLDGLRVMQERLVSD